MLENSVTRAVFPMGEITISQWKRHNGFWFNSKTGTGRKWSSYLFVNLSKLFQVVLKKGNFLLLRSTSASIVTVKLNALHREFQSSAKPCRNSRGSSGILECKFAKGQKAFLSPKLKRSYFTCSVDCPSHRKWNILIEQSMDPEQNHRLQGGWKNIPFSRSR